MFFIGRLLCQVCNIQILPVDAMIPCIFLALGRNLVDGAVANLRGCGKEAAAILFWVYIFNVFSMAGWIFLYLSLLFES